MNKEQIDPSSAQETSVSISGATQPKPMGRAMALALVLGAISLALGGCASDGYVGVTAYPDYSPYYGYYGYGGTPYYGYGGVYTHRVVVGNRRHSGGYGHHHFTRDRRGGYRHSFPRSNRTHVRHDRH